MNRITGFLLFTGIVIFAGLYFQEKNRPPETVEIPVKTIVEVPRDVIKEIPVEKKVFVEKIVEVPVEVKVPVPVEVQLTPRQSQALALGEAVLDARVSSNDTEQLDGIAEVSAFVSIDEDLTKELTPSAVQNRFELTLRKSGIKIDSNSTNVAFVYIEGMWVNDEQVTFAFSTFHGVQGSALVGRNGNFLLTSMPLWRDGSVGYVGAKRASEMALQIAESAAEAIANALLAANSESK